MKITLKAKNSNFNHSLMLVETGNKLLITSESGHVLGSLEVETKIKFVEANEEENEFLPNSFYLVLNFNNDIIEYIDEKDKVLLSQ